MISAIAAFPINYYMLLSNIKLMLIKRVAKPIAFQPQQAIIYLYQYLPNSLSASQKNILVDVQCILIRNRIIFLLQNFKIQKRMAEQSLPQWQQLIYSPSNLKIPLSRWGHKLVLTNNNQIFMFGGFGGEGTKGQYLNDLWKLDLSDYIWKEVVTTGQLPQSRSNYTLHYSQPGNQLILFGGGSSSKERFNSVCLLHLDTMVWEKIMPNATEQAPWERTYHCSEFSYPYLIIHGGEGASCIDLDDSWVFNITSKTWKKLHFREDSIKPSPRRFHCSALVNNKFYVFGGCKDNYDLLGDMHRVDLKQLFQQGKTTDFLWQRVLSGKRDLQRWGHSCNVRNNKLYIFAGRISSIEDTQELLVFDTESLELSKMNVKNVDLPQPRRRHSTVLVGNCLLSFGGYNGKYLNDSYYICLPKEAGVRQGSHLTIAEHESQFMHQIQSIQYKKLNHKESLFVKAKDGQQIKLQTNYAIISHNSYFKYLQQYSQSQTMCVQLPSFCSLSMFRVIHLGLIQGNVIVCRSHPLSYYINFVKSLQYFNCNLVIGSIEQYLCSQLNKLNKLNSMEMLYLSLTLAFNRLKQQSAQICIKNAAKMNQNGKGSKKLPSLLASNQNLRPNQDLYQLYVQQVLGEAHKIYRFQIEQSQMRRNAPNFFIKTANKLKRMFSLSQQNQAQNRSQQGSKDSREKRAGCLSRLMNFFTNLSRG